jgi:hypothetical protein
MPGVIRNDGKAGSDETISGLIKPDRATYMRLASAGRIVRNLASSFRCVMPRAISPYPELVEGLGMPMPSRVRNEWIAERTRYAFGSSGVAGSIGGVGGS